MSGDDAKVYRVFEGKKGALKAIDVVDARWDQGFNVLTVKTKNGTVLVKRDPNEKTEYTLRPTWEGKKADIVAVPRAANWRLIYEGLGVYPERPSPTPCDPMLP
jgi:hypothetical protein